MLLLPRAFCSKNEVLSIKGPRGPVLASLAWLVFSKSFSSLQRKVLKCLRKEILLSRLNTPPLPSHIYTFHLLSRLWLPRQYSGKSHPYPGVNDSKPQKLGSELSSCCMEKVQLGSGWALGLHRLHSPPWPGFELSLGGHCRSSLLGNRQQKPRAEFLGNEEFLSLL